MGRGARRTPTQRQALGLGFGRAERFAQIVPAIFVRGFNGPRASKHRQAFLWRGGDEAERRSSISRWVIDGFFADAVALHARPAPGRAFFGGGEQSSRIVLEFSACGRGLLVGSGGGGGGVGSRRKTMERSGLEEDPCARRGRFLALTAIRIRRWVDRCPERRVRGAVARGRLH